MEWEWEKGKGMGSTEVDERGAVPKGAWDRSVWSGGRE